MKTRSPPKTPQARLRQLVPYYAGCLRMEANRGATALSGEVAPRWFEPPGEPWHRRGLEPVCWPSDALPPGLLDRACSTGAAVSRPVFYGYPLLALEGNTGAGGAPAWIPALLCPIELRSDGNEVHAARTNDPPMINADFLGAIARDSGGAPTGEQGPARSVGGRPGAGASGRTPERSVGRSVRVAGQRYCAGWHGLGVHERA